MNLQANPQALPMPVPAPSTPAPTSAVAPTLPTLESLAAEVAGLRARVAALEAQAGVASVAEAVAAPEPIAIAPVATAEPVAALPGMAPPAARPNDPMGEIQALLNAMFSVALHANPESLDQESVDADFERFLSLVHDARKGSPLLNQELFHYKWRPLCKRARAYLADPADPTSYKITQVTPTIDKIDARSEIVRLFLRTEKRMPPPLLLRRDPRAGDAFRIDQSSL